MRRSAADFDNVRKRSRKEVDDAKKAGREDLLKELLPVFDNLERASAGPNWGANISLAHTENLVGGTTLRF